MERPSQLYRNESCLIPSGTYSSRTYPMIRLSLPDRKSEKVAQSVESSREHIKNTILLRELLGVV
jgi:hypothetical protein